MLNWITDNLSTIIVSLVLILIVAAIIQQLVRDKKKGNPLVAATVHTVQWRGPATNRNKKTSSA